MLQTPTSVGFLDLESIWEKVAYFHFPEQQTKTFSIMNLVLGLFHFPDKNMYLDFLDFVPSLRHRAPLYDWNVNMVLEGHLER